MSSDYDVTITINIQTAFQVGPGAGRTPNVWDGDGSYEIKFPSITVTVKNGGTEDFKPAQCTYIGTSNIDFKKVPHGSANGKIGHDR